jgi:hypothetical protein
MSDALSTTFRVGRLYKCTIVLPLPSSRKVGADIQTTWEPATPIRLTEAEMRDYRRGRDALLLEAARYLGGKVAIIEI